MHWIIDDAWVWVALMLIWIPFAIAGGLVDTWDTPGGRQWRSQIAHPFRSFRENHPRAAVRPSRHPF